MIEYLPRDHVLADLSPYICLYEDCKVPYRCYGSFREWIFHMETAHMSREWVCHSRSHRELIFSDQHIYMNHVKNTHNPTITDTQAMALADASSRPSRALFEKCPLGDEIPRTNQNGSVIHPQSSSGDSSSGQRSLNPRQVIRHIGEHLQLLATLSLAWLGEQSTGANGNSQNGDSWSSRSAISDTPPVVPESETLAEKQPEVDEDPAWSEWVSCDESRKGSRNEEWSLTAEDGTALTMFSQTACDPMMWEFILKFRALKEEDLGGHVLLPPEMETTLVPAEPPAPVSTAPAYESSKSNEGNIDIMKRLLESSERVRETIQLTFVEQDDPVHGTVVRLEDVTDAASRLSFIEPKESKKPALKVPGSLSRTIKKQKKASQVYSGPQGFKGSARSTDNDANDRSAVGELLYRDHVLEESRGQSLLQFSSIYDASKGR